MIAFFKRCWQRRWIRGLAWTFVSLLTLLVFFGVWVNWTGARVWREAQQRVREEKLSLDFRQTLPEPVLDAENFCATPVLRDIAVVVDRDPDKGEPAEKRKAVAALGVPDAYGAPSGMKHPPLEREAGEDPNKYMSAWAAWLRQMHVALPVTDARNPAREVLAALSYQDAAVAEMAARLDLSRAQLQPATKNQVLPDMLYSMQLPHYDGLRRAGGGLALRAAAAIHAGEAAKAHESTRILVRLAQATTEEPFFIGLLMSHAIAAHAVEATKELCLARAGSGEDFLKLQRDFERLDFHAAALRAWEGELAAGVDAVSYLKKTRDLNLLMMLGSEREQRTSEDSIFARLLPTGFFDMNAANMVHMELDYAIRPLRDRGWQGVLKLQPEMERSLKLAKANWPTNLDKIFPCLLMPAASTVASKSVYGQCRVNQAIIACALERYFAEHQSYPDALEVLNRSGGSILPVDPANGSPMRYRKTEDGRYKLWSVGFDLVDDGGRGPDKDAKGDTAKPSRTEYKGDWVWEYAAGK